MTLSQSIREQRLRSHLADSREALDDLGSALTLVHPDRARDTAQRCLETARQALDDARELVWTDGQGRPDGRLPGGHPAP